MELEVRKPRFQFLFRYVICVRTGEVLNGTVWKMAGNREFRMKSQVQGSTAKKTKRPPSASLVLQAKVQIAFCIVLVVAMASQYELTVVIPSDFSGLILVALFFVYFSVVAWCLVNLLVYKFNRFAVATFVSALAFGVVALIAPSTVLNLDWRLKEKDRDDVVRRVLSGEIVPDETENGVIIRLPDGYPSVSKGGNIIVIEEHDGKKYILFYVKPGDGDFVGFLYVEDGGDPWLLSRMSKHYGEIRPQKQNWYYVSHY